MQTIVHIGLLVLGCPFLDSRNVYPTSYGGWELRTAMRLKSSPGVCSHWEFLKELLLRAPFMHVHSPYILGPPFLRNCQVLVPRLFRHDPPLRGSKATDLDRDSAYLWLARNDAMDPYIRGFKRWGKGRWGLGNKPQYNRVETWDPFNYFHPAL